MNKRPGRVLIVDDCPTDRAVMSHRLTSNGYQVMEAESGATALRLMMSDRFDLVLLDIIMPGLDGIEVLKRIRLRHSPLALPVIMVTAKNESEDVVESLELGANDYICKPVSLPVALARVEVQIARKRTQEELIRANGDLDRYVRQLLVANQRLEVEAARARVA